MMESGEIEPTVRLIALGRDALTAAQVATRRGALALRMKLPRGLVGEGQAGRLVRGRVALLAPGREGTRTNPDPGDSHAGLLQFPFRGLGPRQPPAVSRGNMAGTPDQRQTAS